MSNPEAAERRAGTDAGKVADDGGGAECAAAVEAGPSRTSVLATGATGLAAEEPSGAEGSREVQQVAPASTTNISCSRGFADWLRMHRVSIALSTYQTGQLFLIGVLPNQSISIHQRNFVRAMGLVGQNSRIYVAGIEAVWRLENVLGDQERANAHYDRLYVPRNAQVTGDIDIHELGIETSGRVIFVNTKYSCLATFSMTHSFLPLWKPSFISRLAAEDRCHLNGLAMQDGKAKYVTAVSRSDTLDGWRKRRHDGGVIIDVETDRIVSQELSMPHSPRVAGGTLYALDSGRGHLVRVDPDSGRREVVAFCPGFLRGLSIWNNHALVTVSLPRDGTFKGLELESAIRARDGEPWCGCYVIDLQSGDIRHWIRFDGFIKELFDVAVLPGVACPMAVGLGTPELQHIITIEPHALHQPSGAQGGDALSLLQAE